MTLARALDDLTLEEQKLVRRVVASVARRLPDHPQERVVECTVGALADYRHARVRDFLPILLERLVVTRLTT